MSKTRHIQQRMSQRSIHQEMLDLVKMFGVDSGDKTILNKRGIDLVLKELKNMSKTMQKMRSRGGIVLVEAGDNEITSYALNSFRK